MPEDKNKTRKDLAYLQTWSLSQREHLISAALRFFFTRSDKPTATHVNPPGPTAPEACTFKVRQYGIVSRKKERKNRKSESNWRVNTVVSSFRMMFISEYNNNNSNERQQCTTPFRLQIIITACKAAPLPPARANQRRTSYIKSSKWVIGVQSSLRIQDLSSLT